MVSPQRYLIWRLLQCFQNQRKTPCRDYFVRNVFIITHDKIITFNLFCVKWWEWIFYHKFFFILANIFYSLQMNIFIIHMPVMFSLYEVQNLILRFFNDVSYHGISWMNFITLFWFWKAIFSKQENMDRKYKILNRCFRTWIDFAKNSLYNKIDLVIFTFFSILVIKNKNTLYFYLFYYMML